MKNNNKIRVKQLLDQQDVFKKIKKADPTLARKYDDMLDNLDKSLKRDIGKCVVKPPTYEQLHRVL